MADKFKVGDRVRKTGESLVWIVDEIQPGGLRYMLSHHVGSIETVQWANEDDLVPALNPLVN